jgi:hypothetical protein
MDSYLRFSLQATSQVISQATYQATVLKSMLQTSLFAPENYLKADLPLPTTVYSLQSWPIGSVVRFIFSLRFIYFLLKDPLLGST